MKQSKSSVNRKSTRKPVRRELVVSTPHVLEQYMQVDETAIAYYVADGWLDSGWRFDGVAMLYKDCSCPQTQTGHGWYVVKPVDRTAIEAKRGRSR